MLPICESLRNSLDGHIAYCSDFVAFVLLNKGPKAICIAFITAYCCNCSILSLVIAVHLLLSLIYELNFAISMCAEENTVYIGFGTTVVSGVHWGVLESALLCG